MGLKPTERSENIDELEEMGTIECGKEAAKHFAFGDGYRNLNHGRSRQPSVDDSAMRACMTFMVDVGIKSCTFLRITNA